MRSHTFHRLVPLWPFWMPGLAFLAGFAFDGAGGGVLAATLAFLVAGPAYLLRQRSLRRSGRLPPSEPRAPAEQARLLRLFALVNAAAALGLLAAAAADGRPGRPGALVLLGGIGLLARLRYLSRSGE